MKIPGSEDDLRRISLVAARVPGTVSFLNPQPTLSVGDTNRPSCPKADLHGVRTKPPRRVENWSIIRFIG
jgi:hypothetical protein